MAGHPEVMAEFAFVFTKFLHVLGAVLWLGAAVYQNYLHVPALKRLEGKERLAAMAATFRRTNLMYGAVGILTVLFGLEVGRRVYGTMNVVSWWTEPVGASRYVFVGFWLTLVALLLGILHMGPTKRLEALVAEPYGSEVDREAGDSYVRLAMLGHTSVLLLVIVLGAMVAANLGGV